MPHPLDRDDARALGTAVIQIAAPRADSVREARRQVGDLTRERLSGERRRDAMLLTSELVTNSVLHGGDGPITVWAGMDGRRLRVEVHDQGQGLPPGRPSAVADRERRDGRGLQLVATLADRWGHRRRPWAVVWFEIDLG